MNAVDMLLLSVLALAGVSLSGHVLRGLGRQMKEQRMMRALRGAIRREIGVETTIPAASPVLVLQQAHS